MFETIEQVIFDPIVARKGRTIDFNSPPALVEFRHQFYAMRARIARREKVLASRADQPEPDPVLWGGDLLTIRKGPTTLWVGPRNQTPLGVKRVR